MRTNFKSVILGATVLAAAVTMMRGANVYSVNVVSVLTPGPEPQSVTGNWNSEFDGAIGHIRYTYDLKQDGTKLSGKATRIADTGTNTTDITEGKVDGNAVSFVEALNIQGQDLRIEYKGKLSATNTNELDLTRAVGEFATNDIVATRQAAAMVTGKWNAEFDTQIGHVKYTYDLKQDGGKLSGTAIRSQDDQKTETAITNGLVSGDEVSFLEQLKIQGQDQQIDITYKGKLAGDEIKFTRAVGEFATNEISAKREK